MTTEQRTTDPLLEAIGRRREILGLTQIQLSQMTGISPATISGYETGRITQPRLDIARKLAVAVGLRFAVLMEGEIYGRDAADHK